MLLIGEGIHCWNKEAEVFVSQMTKTKIKIEVFLTYSNEMNVKQPNMLRFSGICCPSLFCFSDSIFFFNSVTSIL